MVFYKHLLLEIQIPIVRWDLISSHEEPEVWLHRMKGEGLDGESCGQFTTEGIHSLVIKGNCKNKGRLGFLALIFTQKLLLSNSWQAPLSLNHVRTVYSAWGHRFEDG